MQYIEDNFKDMPSGKFSEHEMGYLKWFLPELKNNSSVYGILLVPIYKELDRRYYIDDYCEANFCIVADTSSDDIKKVYQITDSIRQAFPFSWYIPTNYIAFGFEDKEKYFNPEEHVFLKGLWNTELVSSYIIFDRNGYLSMRQELLKDTVEPIPQLAKISNIDELDSEVVIKHKSKVKKSN